MNTEQQSTKKPNDGLKAADEILSALESGTLQEHLHINLELKESWAVKHGAKLSALANKLDQVVSFLAVGITDDGKVVPKQPNWAKEQEEILSQHVNKFRHFDVLNGWNELV